MGDGQWGSRVDSVAGRAAMDIAAALQHHLCKCMCSATTIGPHPAMPLAAAAHAATAGSRLLSRLLPHLSVVALPRVLTLPLAGTLLQRAGSSAAAAAAASRCVRCSSSSSGSAESAAGTQPASAEKKRVVFCGTPEVRLGAIHRLWGASPAVQCAQSPSRALQRESQTPPVLPSHCALPACCISNLNNVPTHVPPSSSVPAIGTLPLCPSPPPGTTSLHTHPPHCSPPSLPPGGSAGAQAPAGSGCSTRLNL